MMNIADYNKALAICLLMLMALMMPGCRQSRQGGIGDQPNILLLTLDDMGYGTSGAEGCKVPGITPNIDRLASEGLLVTHGFVMTPICGPSRAAMLSGRYPHCNGVMGHGEQPPDDWANPRIITPTITHCLHDAGYTTGAILKNARTQAFHVWDVDYDEAPFGVGYHDRNPASFYERTKAFINLAKANGKPFFLYANPIDPHRPWVDTGQEKEMLARWNPDRPFPGPGKEYAPEEVEVPHFLPDLPEIRKNLVPYYESLHRGDACIGSILKALHDSGQEKNTLVIFLSDNGMGAIGAKATLYHDGIRTPVIIRWPGKVKPGRKDDESIISSVDLVPTIIEASGLPALNGLEGRSFYNVLTGKLKKTEREYAYAAFNYLNDTSPENFLPQRAIINREYCYIWNSYVARSNGKKRFPASWSDVVSSSLDGSHPELSQKIESILNKPVEELFELGSDPGCWDNLAGDPAFEEVLQEYRAKLRSEMESTEDPELQIFMGK